MPTKIIVKRFWGYVNKTSSCWLWTAGCFQNGYGQFRVGKKKVKAHRFSYQLANGAILPGISVCHTCDNRKCVNPQHLFLSTAKGNAQDREAKKRHPHLNGYDKSGRNNPSAKLNESDVNKIRSMRKNNLSYQKIADKYGISKSQVGNIIRGESWQKKAK